MSSAEGNDANGKETRHIEGIRRQADEALRRLASSAEVQIGWLREIGVGIADELALEFDYWSTVVLSLPEIYRPSQDTVDGLRHLNQLLDDISGPTGLWSFEALSSSHEWMTIRSEAIRVLVLWEADLLHLPRDQSPSSE